MTLRHLAELSALIALHGDQWIVPHKPVSDTSLGRYLDWSKRRCQAWRGAVARITEGSPEASRNRAAKLQALLAEVLVTEMMTRLWTAVLCTSDAQHGRVHAAPIARHVLVSVLETRTRHLRRLVQNETLPVTTLQQADRLRRKFDRWTDLLMGELATRHDVLDFAADPERAGEYRDQSQDSDPQQAAVTWKLLCAGLYRAVPHQPVAIEGEQAHQGVIHSILTTLPGTPLTLQSPPQLPTGWSIRPAAPAQRVLPPSVASRLGQDHIGPDPRASDLLAELLRRLDNRPTDHDASSEPA